MRADDVVGSGGVWARRVCWCVLGGVCEAMNHWFYMTDAEYDRLNPPQANGILGDDGYVYEQVITDPHWLPVGYIPTPRSRLEWLVYHLLHGLAMRYRFLPVLAWSFREVFGRAMIDFDFNQQWRDYVAALHGPKITTTIELDDDSDTFMIDSVQKVDGGFLIDAHGEDGEPWVFSLRLTGDE